MHALVVGGVDDIRVFSKFKGKGPRKSEMFGAQYLHSPIPGMTTTAPVTVKYKLTGTAEEYRNKVYGPTYNGPVSPEELAGEHDAWDIRSTYDELWDAYSGLVEQVELTPQHVAQIVLASEMVVSSVPAPILCMRPGIHTFHASQVQALGDAPERGQLIPYRTQVPNNTVSCNGESSPSWYRLSRLFDYATVEWAGNVTVPLSGVATVQKPLYTDCSCFPSIRRVGRYGKWVKGSLSHEAFQDVLAELIP